MPNRSMYWFAPIMYHSQRVPLWQPLHWSCSTPRSPWPHPMQSWRCAQTRLWRNRWQPASTQMPQPVNTMQARILLTPIPRSRCRHWEGKVCTATRWKIARRCCSWNRGSGTRLARIRAVLPTFGFFLIPSCADPWLRTIYLHGSGRLQSLLGLWFVRPCGNCWESTTRASSNACSGWSLNLISSPSALDASGWRNRLARIKQDLLQAEPRSGQWNPRMGGVHPQRNTLLVTISLLLTLRSHPWLAWFLA